MSDEPDERDDDPQLRSLRAVWLALPDEDPPARGLEALMAAATAKAKDMAVPAVPWWRRMLDQLRRPPVLALATVMVLLGGAVLIGKRGGEPAQPTIDKTPARDTTRGDETLAPDKERALDQREPATKPAIETKDPSTNTVTVPQTAPHAGAGSAAPVVPEPPARPPPKHSRPAHEPVQGGVIDHHTGFTPTTKTEPPKVKTKLETATDHDATSMTEDEATEPGAKGEASRGPREVMVDQLLEQSRSAASRGDCESSRLIANRIAKQNAAFYRERVATDAAIKKCIAAAADAAQ